MDFNIEAITKGGLDWILREGPKFLLAVVIIVVGMYVIKKLIAIVTKLLAKTGVSETIQPFFISIVSVALKLALIIIIAGVVGIELTFFVAILTAATFAIGMSLQGSLGHFASGILILFFKPYKVGDWIQIEDFFGQVMEIQILNTILKTPGQKTLIIPNGKVTDAVVTNMSTQEKIRLELSVTMPYAESFPKVKSVIAQVLRDCDYVLQEPVPEIGIVNYDSHNIEVTIKPFIHPGNYWDATYQVYEKVKYAFHQNGIQVSYSEGIELGSIGE